jgi:hypothetical protein
LQNTDCPTPIPTYRSQNCHIPRASELKRKMVFQELVSFEDVAVDFPWEE